MEQGELNSYLIEITAEVLRQNDAETDKLPVDLIVDQAPRRAPASGPCRLRWTSLFYFDQIRAERLSAALIQGRATSLVRARTTVLTVKACSTRCGHRTVARKKSGIEIP